MPIDGSGERFSVESTQRVEALRRIERSTPSKQSGEKFDRRERKGTPPETPPVSELPHDVVDISHPPDSDSVNPSDNVPPRRQAASEDNYIERHLDISA